MNNHEYPKHPPQPPKLPKKLAFERIQWIGIPLLMLLPILALLGVFGESFGQAAAANETLNVSIEYPSRTRFLMTNVIQVSIENLSAADVEDVTVTFPTDYINEFSEVGFEPPLSELTADVYRVSLPVIHAGETRLVRVEIEAEDFGRYNGEVVVSTAENEDDAIHLPITTWVFP